MKTIEEQAREYAQTHYSGDGWFSSYEDVREAFIDGFETATRWIPVEEEPDDKDNILIALDYRGGVHTIFWEAIKGHNRIIQNDRKDTTFKYYTHWLPIPTKPGK